MTSRHFCGILFVRSKSLGPAHTQAAGLSPGCDYQEAGIIGSHLRRFLPHSHFTNQDTEPQSEEE